MPSRLPFPQNRGAAILDFGWEDVVGTDCSLILLVGKANSRFFSVVICRVSSVPTIFSFVHLFCPHVLHLGFGASAWFESAVPVFVA